MKNFVLHKIVFSLILSALAVLCVAFSLVPLLSSRSADTDKAPETTADTVVIYADTDSGKSDDINSLFMSDGYKVLGGDLYCEHTWNDWILTKVSTITKGGSELRYCSSCNAHQVRTFGEEHGDGSMELISGVPMILQMPNYPNGCEVVSLTMVLKYMGHFVTTDQLIDDHLPRGYFGNNRDDPFYKYLGDPRDLGVGCYAPCIVGTANSYLNSIGEFGGAVDVSGKGFEVYKDYIDKDIPVIFWGTTYMDCDPEVFGTIYLENKDVIWRNHSHCFVMIGYTDSTYVFADPLRGVIEYPIADVEKSHSLVYSQACIIQ